MTDSAKVIRNRRWQNKQIAAGRCAICGDPAVPNRTRCEPCAEKNRQYQRELRQLPKPIMSKSIYHDQILDLLSDGLERTVEEIRKGVAAPDGARLHHILSEMLTFASQRKYPYRLRSRRVCGKIYYRYVPRASKP